MIFVRLEHYDSMWTRLGKTGLLPSFLYPLPRVRDVRLSHGFSLLVDCGGR